jgi:photosystem II stability/assembly factor-like uncharacterized protein
LFTLTSPGNNLQTFYYNPVKPNHYKNLISGFILTVCGLFSFSQTSSTQWSNLTSPDPTWELRGVNFYSANYGYAIGRKGLSLGAIFRTTDGGQSWTKFTHDKLKNGYSIFCIDSLHVVSAGYMLQTYSMCGNVSVSADAGMSWSVKCSDYYPLAVYFPDTAVGYGACKDGNVIKSTDGGAYFSTVVIPSGGQGFNSVFFTDANTGYIAGNQGNIFKTTNGGVNWVKLPVDSITDNLFSVFFTGPNHGYICGQNGLMLETQDAGATWSWSRPGGSDALYSVHFPTPETGYAVGANSRITKAHVTWGTSSGDDLPEIHSLIIYPNPARDQAFIQLPPDAGRENRFTLTITDVSGKQVEKQVSADGNGVITFSLGPFSKGLYVVKLEQGQKQYVGKLSVD